MFLWPVGNSGTSQHIAVLQNNGSLLQHSVLERVFRKTYVASNCSDIALYASIIAAVAVLFAQLETRQGAISWKMVRR